MNNSDLNLSRLMEPVIFCGKIDFGYQEETCPLHSTLYLLLEFIPVESKNI